MKIFICPNKSALMVRSDPPVVNKSMYVVGEIGEPELVGQVSTKPKYLLFTILGILVFVLGFAVYLYSAAIMVSYGLRARYWNFGFISLGLALLLFYVSAYLRNDLGKKVFTNQYHRYVISSTLGKTEIIKKTEIYALSVQSKTLFFDALGERTYVILSLYDRTIELPLYRFEHEQDLVNYFSHLAVELQDEYYTVFQKTEISYPSMLSRLWGQMTGKLGLVILGLYLIMAAWGAFSMLLYPSNSIYVNSFFLKNPEISFSFLPGYDSRTIVYVPPNDTFIFGTDWFGRDIFSRLIHGTVHTFGVAFFGSTIYITLVVILGYLSGFSRGVVDEVISRLGDILQVFPTAVVLLIIAAFANAMAVLFAEQYYYIIFMIAAFITWPRGSKLLRTETRRLLREEYIAVSRHFGGGSWHVMFHHVLPKTSSTIVLLFIYSFTEIIIGMTMIGLLGMGGASSLTWGSDLEKAITFVDVPLENRWWTLIFPLVWVSVLIIGLTLLSDSIRDQYQISRNELMEVPV